jgi:hypothetical protein
MYTILETALGVRSKLLDTEAAGVAERNSEVV